ncbi:CHASE4 domain protein [Sporomusa ovata DSM 2662]|uniref:CHASE4 domain-containing protein n=1 Tax=Sporomusa ovata TaxID=2378 RepID=A0A0U1L5G5_9FIRM|nr:CHASE4 domain-containing protein [Sporomusa ovata]EQB28597.1 CHASE4 domain containing protein [Sporomusa ovata DSM 2662]CQR74931.1 hypothetical protein SpAn4DRAFT_4288 [Sporomusa ovata]
MDAIEDAQTGIINIDGAIFIICIAPITTSDETAISNGTLLIGRKIDKEIISYISNLLDAAIVISDNPPATSESTIVVEKNREKN